MALEGRLFLVISQAVKQSCFRVCGKNTVTEKIKIQDDDKSKRIRQVRLWDERKRTQLQHDGGLEGRIDVSAGLAFLRCPTTRLGLQLQPLETIPKDLKGTPHLK